MNEEEKSISLKDLLYIVFKWKKLAIYTVSIILLIAALYTFFVSPTYEASAKVLLKKERPDIILTTEKSDGIHKPITDKDLTAEIEILKNRTLLEKVVKSNKLDQKMEKKNNTVLAYILLPLKALKNIYYNLHSKREITPLEKSIIQFSKNLRINDIRQSDIIEINYQSTDPVAAKNIVNTLTDQYIEYRLNLYGTSQAYDFFQARTKVLEKNLKASTQALRDFQERTGNVISEEGRARLSTQLSDAEADLRMAEVEEQELNQKITYLRGEIQRIKEETIADPARMSDRVLEGLQEQLIALEVQKSDLLQKYTKEHPQVKSVEREIKSLRELITSEQAKSSSPEMMESISAKETLAGELLTAQTRLATVKIRKTSLADQVSIYKTKIREIENLSYTLKELDRKAQADEEIYNAHIKKLKESEVLLELDKLKVINASVIEYAKIPLTPVKPKKARNMLLALVLGLMISFGSVTLLEYFNHSFKNKDDIERFLNIKTLSSIPYKNGM